METRKLLYISRHQNDCAAIRAIEASGWQFARVDEAKSASSMLASGDFHVGIVLIEDAQDARWFRNIEELFARSKGIVWVAVVAPGLLEDATVQDFIAGYFLDFHTLPVKVDKLLFSLGHAWGMARLVPVTEMLNEQGDIIGTSIKTIQLISDLAKFALVDAPVLITGETGTGKELSAREIHRNSKRKTGPFIAVNCAGLPPTLVHAELFGYEKGAFTGAQQRKIGYLEQAHGGTVLLDELGDLPIDLQVLLLRFLQEKTIRRVGGVDDIKVDARVIAATHVDLAASIRGGRFREDLYHRLNVLRAHVPALRERNSDIDALANYFFGKFSTEADSRIRGFSRDAKQAMHQYHWPGNIRELMNRIRRALVMSEHRMITAQDLGITRTLPARLETLEEARTRGEREAITVALQHATGSPVLSAEYLGISRATFYRLLEKHGMATSSLLRNSDKDGPSILQEPRFL